MHDAARQTACAELLLKGLADSIVDIILGGSKIKVESGGLSGRLHRMEELIIFWPYPLSVPSARDHSRNSRLA